MMLMLSCQGKFAVFAAESVGLEWDPNTDVISGYKVYTGVQSGTYSQTINVGNRTRLKVGGLNVQSTYFFMVTAYDSSGLESLPSAEVQHSFNAAAWIDPTTGNSSRLIAPTQDAPNGTFEQYWMGMPNRNYNILKSTDLQNWTVIDTVASGDGLIVWQYVIPGPGSGFFKAELKPP